MRWPLTPQETVELTTGTILSASTLLPWKDHSAIRSLVPLAPVDLANEIALIADPRHGLAPRALKTTIVSSTSFKVRFGNAH